MNGTRKGRDILRERYSFSTSASACCFCPWYSCFLRSFLRSDSMCGLVLWSSFTGIGVDSKLLRSGHVCCMPTTTVRTLGLTNNASQLIAYSLHSFVLPAFGNGNADVERNVGFPGAPVTARGRNRSVISRTCIWSNIPLHRTPEESNSPNWAPREAAAELTVTLNERHLKQSTNS